MGIVLRRVASERSARIAVSSGHLRYVMGGDGPMQSFS